ncbi:hypothetical protein BJX63DRAFT_416818, partial [Aspergillus granulosus]
HALHSDILQNPGPDITLSGKGNILWDPGPNIALLFQGDIFWNPGPDITLSNTLYILPLFLFYILAISSFSLLLSPSSLSSIFASTKQGWAVSRQEDSFSTSPFLTIVYNLTQVGYSGFTAFIKLLNQS